MPRILALLGAALVWTAAVARADDAGKYTIKELSSPPPKELREPIRKLLNEKAIQLLTDKGSVLCDVWLRKELPAKATPEQVKNGLTYRELEESTVFGAIRYEQEGTDYRKQKIKPGVYTLRLGFQPMDGDHMGTAPYPEFCLLSPAAEDKKPDPMDPKALHDLSAKASMATHPAVMLLMPNDQPKDKPELAAKEMDTWVVYLKADTAAKAPLGLSLTLIGHSTAE